MSTHQENNQHQQMTTAEVEKFLHRHGVKPTPQRMVIAQYVLNSKSHPTADQIFQEVAQDLPVLLSRATVYNTLNTLVEAGAVREVYIQPGPARYDANIEEHHHFVDIKTGKVIDIDSTVVPSIASELGPKFKVHHYSVTFFGELENEGN
jgi:Fur family transcriptional regulator, iron response regulator